MYSKVCRQHTAIFCLYTFPPIVWILTEGEGDGMESRLSSQIFSTLLFKTNQRNKFYISSAFPKHFYLLISEDKYPEVPFHRITLSYILKNINFCTNSARSKTRSRKNISWTEMKNLLTKPSNVLPFYTSSQNSNLLCSEVDSLKRS